NTPSRWRECRFLFHQVCRAIDPPIRMTDVLHDWSAIVAGLAEPNRKRRPQIERYGWMNSASKTQLKTS
ncbi:MAG: hypothetical protein OXC62_07950, partial [Aestuariivita sp.]|nr:hypothetical protein [Aestuariivita sp.]